jgi:hypothetical protein
MLCPGGASGEDAAVGSGTSEQVAPPGTAAPPASPETEGEATAGEVIAGGEAARPEAAADARGEAAPSILFVSPEANAVLDTLVTTIILQFSAGREVELRLNGTKVDPSLVGRTETDPTANIVTQYWYGVALWEGDNTLTARLTSKGDADARAGGDPGVGVPTSPRRTDTATLKVQVRGAPKQLVITSAQARIPADGRSTALIRGQLLDARGNRSNRDAIVTLTATDGEWMGADFNTDEPGFQVQVRQGAFSANLRATLKAQTVRIRAGTGELQAWTQLVFETDLRPALLTGFLNLRLGRTGSDLYRSFREFAPGAAGGERWFGLHSAGFATGSVGDWLFTGAYNNRHPLNQNLHGQSGYGRDIQPSEQLYAVYGDSSRAERLATSRDRLYLRLERNRDFLMWGDYATPEFASKAQQFTAVSRQFHAMKANYHAGKMQFTGFYGDNIQGFQRDTIAPDGTSGYYFLSRRRLVFGSESVVIELEEFNRPGTVLDRQVQRRTLDYEIDYDRGTLLFRRPILRTDVDGEGRVLVRRIVATYQFDRPGSGASVLGTRLQYHLCDEMERESCFGTTYMRENGGLRNFQLYGADAIFSLAKHLDLIAEVARSRNDTERFLGAVSGSAYRLELERTTGTGLQGRAYYRSATTGFSNNATVSFVPGQSRLGAQLTGQATPTTRVRLQLDRETNRGTAPVPLDIGAILSPGAALPGTPVDNQLTTISAGVDQRLGRASLGVDLVRRNRDDRISPESLSSDSTQLQSRLTAPITGRLTFQAQDHRSLGSVDPVFPDRTQFGLDWAVAQGVNVRLNQIFFSGGPYDGRQITSLETAADYKLSENAALKSRFAIMGGADGATAQGAVGLDQRWKVAPGLNLSLSYERIMGRFFEGTAAGPQFPQPYARGQNGASLGFGGADSYGVGLEYTNNPDFKASARFENRTSAVGRNRVISAAAVGKLAEPVTILARYQQAATSNQLLRGVGDIAEVRLGVAYRNPADDRWNALMRYEFRKNPNVMPETLLIGSGTGSIDHLFALEMIHAPRWNWEFYGKYAFRNSTSYLSQDFIGYSTVSLAQLRAAYRFGFRSELVGETRWIQHPSANYQNLGFIVEAGYYLTPDLRLGVGYSLGRVNDRDFTGSRSVKGPYVDVALKVNELFQGFGQRSLARRGDRGSRVADARGATTDHRPPTTGTGKKHRAPAKQIAGNRRPPMDSWPAAQPGRLALAPVGRRLPPRTVAARNDSGAGKTSSSVTIRAVGVERLSGAGEPRPSGAPAESRLRPAAVVVEARNAQVVARAAVEGTR